MDKQYKSNKDFPKKFKFSTGSSIVYTAIIGTEDIVLVEWYNRASNLTYYGNSFAETFTRYDWKIIDVLTPAETNGVDGNDNPLNFTVDMLKPFMRCVMDNGDIYIVTPSVQNSYEVNMVDKDNNWIGRFEKPNPGCMGIVEVYDLPDYNYKMLIHKEKGPLLWKRGNPKAEAKEAAKKALEAAQTAQLAAHAAYLETHYKLEEAQRAFNNLQ